MKQAHRTAHRTIWIILAILIATGFAMALIKRKPQKKAGTAIVMSAEAMGSQHNSTTRARVFQ